MCLKIIFILLSCTLFVNGAKILGIFYNPAKSHFMLGNTLLEELARRGHQVTMMGPYSANTTFDNYEIIEIEGLQQTRDEAVERMKTVVNGTLFAKVRSVQVNFKELSAKFLDHPTVKHVLNSNRTYDLVIIDWVFNEAFLAIADHFKAHSIVFNSVSSSSAVHKLTANPAPSSYVNNILPPVSHEMTFFERLLNTFGKYIVFEISEVIQKYTHNNLIKKHFPNAPYIEDLYRNVSLVLINSYLTIETAKPYVPSMIPIGGFHITKPKPLDKELKIFLDEATEGVLYCGFGSIMKATDLGSDKIEAIINTFAKLPLKVLWKFESDHVPELPPNVKTRKWFSQSDVLAHPNVKLFITHGGGLSIQEAVYHGVPMIAMPFLLEPEANVAIAVSRGIAKKLTFNNMNEKTLTSAIKEVLNNPNYAKNIKNYSEWFRDRPMKPLDTAMYWIEYVLRHKGAHHLKTAAIKLTWYQHFLLDVFAFILGVLATIFIILRTLLNLLNRIISKKTIVTPKKYL